MYSSCSGSGTNGKLSTTRSRGAAAPARAAARLALGAALGGVALDARRRAARVDAGSGEAVADFYMHLWKCFFACYALLPFVR